MSRASVLLNGKDRLSYGGRVPSFSDAIPILSAVISVDFNPMGSVLATGSGDHRAGICTSGLRILNRRSFAQVTNFYVSLGKI